MSPAQAVGKPVVEHGGKCRSPKRGGPRSSLYDVDLAVGNATIRRSFFSG